MEYWDRGARRRKAVRDSLSISCHINRRSHPSSLYYEPGGEAAEDLRLMRLIDEQYTARPFYGSRRMTIRLNEHGEGVNRK